MELQEDSTWTYEKFQVDFHSNLLCAPYSRTRKTRHFPANTDRASGLIEFDDCENELERMLMDEEISQDEYDSLLERMNEVGKLTHVELVERGIVLHLYEL